MKGDEAVAREIRRILERGSRYGVTLDDMCVHQRDGVSIIFAREAHGIPLVEHETPRSGGIRILEDGQIDVVLNLLFTEPALVTMIKKDGTVVRGASEEVRNLLTAWWRADARAAYEERLAQLGRELETERRRATK